MKDIIIGIDAGTSVIKSVAFSTAGEQIAVSTISNHYRNVGNAGVEQDLEQTWNSTLQTLVALSNKIDNLADRLASIAITAQGDGTWLIDRDGASVCPAWLWLDARSASLVESMRKDALDSKRFSISGTGLNACQQGPQLAYMKKHQADVLEQTHTAFHCKDWLYFKLTGERVTDPSEGCFTFGDFRTRKYSDEVIEILGLQQQRSILPPIVDGVKDHHTLHAAAAKACGLHQGTPIVLGYVDILCTALGAGLYDPHNSTGCTIIGSTGVHMGMARNSQSVVLNDDRTGYTMPMPIEGVYAMVQTNMSATLNIDWLLDIALDIIKPYNSQLSRDDLIAEVGAWIDSSTAGQLVYHPYISNAGERGPFIDSNARAGFVGLSSQHRFADLVRGVVEGLAYAARDCYEAMGTVPGEIRLTGGASKSAAVRAIFGNVLGSNITTSERKEAGAAGAAMMAAVNIGQYATMDDCVTAWVTPHLGTAENYNRQSHHQYQQTYMSYVQSRKALAPVWQSLTLRDP